MSDVFSIKGKTALVTGGSAGIGFMITKGLVKAGVKVYITSRKEEVCKETEKAMSEIGECVAIPGDLSTEEGCLKVVEEIKQREESLDILVNNAGVTWGAPFDSYPDSAWDKILSLNLKAPFTMTRALVGLLENAGKKGEPARVINISSVAAVQPSSMQAYAYGPSKAGLIQLSRILSNEFIEKNILVNTIAPGLFPSKMTAYMRQTPEMEAGLAKGVPLKRLGNEEDMEGVVVFLCSKASSYMTGNVLYVDGGILARGGV